MTRSQAATEAGVSEHQRKTALRVTTVPKDEFEELVERPDPATITELAARGKKAKPRPLTDLGDRTEDEYRAATDLLDAVDRVSRYSDIADLPLASRGLASQEREQVLNSAARLVAWLGEVKMTVEATPA